MNILDFNTTHVKEAEKLALMNYNEERAAAALLPQIDRIPDLTMFADNGLGAAAFDGEKMLGFLCCCSPWDNAFRSAARGTFSPIHAHGVIKENRSMICKKLYQSAAEKWVKSKITYHAIALYAHDSVSIEAMVSYGFGLRCVDAIREMKSIEAVHNKDVDFCELYESERVKVRDMQRMSAEHLECSPSFIAYGGGAEGRASRVFTAIKEGRHIAFIEIADSGEAFVTGEADMVNICGAFCLPEFRGTGIFQSLMNYAMSVLEHEGYTKLGVDFESFNPTASGFWLKYFTAYTNSVVRRIDECAIRN